MASITSKFLFTSGLGIILIGLAYGLAPLQVMGGIVGLRLDPDGLHILRAVMGLYCGLGALLIVAGKTRSLLRPALILEATVMGGLAAGRLLSLLLDQRAHWFLLLALALELLMLVLCLILLKRTVEP